MTGIVLATAVGLALVGLAVAGINRNYSVHLSGDFEVPIRDTDAQGQAIFHLSEDGTSLDYQLMVANIENVFMAHIHCGQPGVNGPITVWLYPSTAVAPGPVGQGRIDGVIASGTITSANVQPLASSAACPGGVSDLDDVVAKLNSNGAYVNVHTNDGVDPVNTGAGDFPGGEVRGNF